MYGRRSNRFAAFVFLVACFIHGLAHAADTALPAGVEKAASIEGITEYRLANGLKLLLFPDASRPTITVNVTYLVGSRHENYGETGMAHLLEHLLFKGTQKNRHLDEEFQRRGARSNGTTSFDRTNYFEILPSSEDNLRWALQMEADRMVNSRIDKADLDQEMTVVRNEYERGENSPAAVLAKRMQSVAFDWHGYRNSTIGNRSDIENVAIENLRAFYRTWYQPDNAVVLVAGKFDEARALRLAAEAFGSIPRPTRALPRLWTVEPAQDGERSFAVRRPADIQLVLASYKIPGAVHPDHLAMSVAAQVLGSSPAGRLHQALVEAGKATSVAARGAATLDPGLMGFIAAVPKGSSLEEAQRLVTATVEGLAANPPTAREMERAHALREKLADQEWSSPEQFAIALSETIALGDWRLYFHSRERLKRVSAAEVAAAARKYLRPENRTVGLFIPTDDALPAQLPVAPLAAAVLADFKPEGAAAAASEELDPSPAAIDARSIVRRLPGGLKVALLPRRTRGSTVNVSLALHWGDAESLRGKAPIVTLLHPMMMRGTTRYTRQQVSDRLDQLRVSGGINAGGARLRTTREHLPEALAFVAHILREPAFPASEFEQAKRQALASLEQRRGDPGSAANQQLARHYNRFARDDWRYVPTVDESIEDTKAVRLEDLQAFHRDFIGASYAEIAIVGDFDERAALAAIEEHLGAWKSLRPYSHVARDYREVAPLTEAIRIPGKESAVLAARMQVNARDDDPADPDYTALVLANNLLGGGGLSSRLARRIRGQEGLSYAVSTSLVSNSIDPVANFGATASVAPQNIERLEKILRQELDRALSEGFSDAEVAGAKAGILEARALARTRDDVLANGWVDKLHRGRTWAEAAQFEARLKALTPEAVQAAMRRHIDPAKLSVVRAGTLTQ